MQDSCDTDRKDGDRRDAGHEGCWTRGMQDKMDAGQEGCRKGGMQDRRLKRDKGQEKDMQDRRDAGQVGG